ncbi:MAG TPA: Npt1/Npt2 family nucleotide transporter [Candidatus Acidoferrum sp.]|nr:Npt1/Npt2 family nucleotide transporter [Candidatus Acidoferrum sp.]
MKRWIERALNIQAGDLGRGLLLSSCLFLIISSYVIGKVARDSLFLARFQAVQLPYADISCGILVGFVVAGYLRLARRISLRNLLIGSQLFFAANCGLFWVLAKLYHPAWLYPVFYIWVGIFGVLAPTQVWTLANYLLTTREAKRVFGMVGGGAILGWIFAGFISMALARAFGTESLLLGMVPFLVISAVLIYVAWSAANSQLKESKEPPQEASGNEQKDVQGSLRLILSSKYLSAVAAVICISSIVTTLTGWQFKAIAKEFFGNKDRLTIFFGDFYFYAGILALLFQLLLTTRFLRRFGIRTMLFVLPLLVFLGSSGLLIWGTLAAVVFLKGSDQVLRYSLDKSAVELLYLPLSHRVKLQAKWFIDTVIWRLGDGLAGVIVLIFATYLHFAPRQLSFIVLLLIAGWLAAVFVGGRQYLTVLQELINQRRLGADQASALALDRSASELLISKLQVSDHKEILYALSFYEGERARTPHPVVRNLLEHPSSEVRQKALTILSAYGDTSVLPKVEEMLKDPEIAVRTEAMLYLVHHAHVDPLLLLQELSEFEDFSVRSALAAYLARPGEAQNLETARKILEEMAGEEGETGQRTRRETARLLGELPDCFDPLLSRLLDDPSTEVVREAIRSVGLLRKEALAPQLFKQFRDPVLHESVTKALVAFGDSVVGLLSDRLGDPSAPAEERKEIPDVLAGIGTPAAAHALFDHVMEGDATLRFMVISALNRLHRDFPEIPLDFQLLETVLAGEILGHYRTYQILEAISGPGSTEDVVGGALATSLEQELERIFRLLGLLHPQLDLHAVYLGLQSKDRTVHDNSLEFLENVLKSALRVTLVPLLDGRVTPQERARLANQLVRTKLESREQAVNELVSNEDPWLKTCGAYAIGSFRIRSLASELESCLSHADPLLRETARAAKARLEKENQHSHST